MTDEVFRVTPREMELRPIDGDQRLRQRRKHFLDLAGSLKVLITMRGIVSRSTPHAMLLCLPVRLQKYTRIRIKKIHNTPHELAYRLIDAKPRIRYRGNVLEQRQPRLSLTSAVLQVVRMYPSTTR